jgi:circadian clock protein KaiB
MYCLDEARRMPLTPDTPENEPQTSEEYRLRLFVTGSTPRSVRAIRNILALCEKFLQGHYDLEIVDIYQDPAMAKDGQVLAAPTLVRESPLPVRRVIGDCSDTNKVKSALDIHASLDDLQES